MLHSHDEAVSQIAYWDGVGVTKTFTHPVKFDWLAGVGSNARVLDYGCGYGRVMAELSDHGFTDVSGVDPSSALIERGRRMRPGARLAVMASPPHVPLTSASVDVVLLFAVLTCVPDTAAQEALIAELCRLLAQGGLLYISDVTIQDDARNQRRYAAYAQQHDAPYGVFATNDGAVFRHHEVEALRALLVGFELLDERSIEIATMNGHPSRAVQLLARKQ